MKSTVKRLVRRIDRRKLRNNTQRVLHTLLTHSGEWMARTALRVPSVGSRLRDLRKAEFGGFGVQCTTATELRKTRNNPNVRRQTFYRLDPRTVTVEKLNKAFRRVISATR